MLSVGNGAAMWVSGCWFVLQQRRCWVLVCASAASAVSLLTCPTAEVGCLLCFLTALRVQEGPAQPGRPSAQGTTERRAVKRVRRQGWAVHRREGQRWLGNLKKGCEC